MSNEIVKKENNEIKDTGFATQADMQWLSDAMNEDCAGIELQLDRIKIPAGGSTAFEIPSVDGDDSEMVKEITGVILYNHPANAYYTDKYTGGSNPPDCSSFDGIHGIGNPGGSCNPHSGFYEADTSRCLDANGGNPSCNQGGMAVVCVDQGGSKSNCCISKDISPTLACTHGGEPAVCVQGSMIGRKDENGPQGSGINEDVSFTLNATDKHVVAYGIDRAAFNQGQNAKYSFTVEQEVQPTMVAKGPGAVAAPTYSSSKASFFTNAEKELANTLVATDYKDPPMINDTDDNSQYIVRRLTPTECARLQGFPDWWCADLETKNPADEEIKYWQKVFDEHNKAVGKSVKPKSETQIIKWLKKPHSDSAEYKLWGNGVALPCVCFVLAGIVWANKKYSE